MQRTSDHDRQVLASLREDGLIDHLPERLNTLTAAVHIMCSDPFRCPESHQHICRLIPKREGSEEPTVFPLYYPGGALLLAPDSPVLPQGSTIDRDWITAIRMAYEAFGITAVLGESHIACAMAYRHRLDAFRVCELTLRAKRRVEEEVPGVEFFPLLHTHGFRGEERKLSYLIPLERWEEQTQRVMRRERLVSSI